MRLDKAILIIVFICLLTDAGANVFGNVINSLTSFIPNMLYKQTPSSTVRGLSNPSTNIQLTETKSTEVHLTDNACLRLELVQIRLNALKNFVRKRKEYLEEIQRNGLQVTDKIRKLVRLDVNIAENDIKMIENLMKQPELFVDPS